MINKITGIALNGLLHLD